VPGVGDASGFLSLAAIAVVALVVFWRFVPKINRSGKTSPILQKIN
jgi:hypothetical protein